MLINYIKIAVRNLLKNKLFSFLNVIGISLSLACVFTISLFVNDELSYDSHIADAERKYRLYNYRVTEAGEAGNFAVIPFPMATYLQKDFPEIESTLRIMDTFGKNLFETGDKQIEEANGIFAESAIFDMFSLQLIDGDASALEKAN